MARSLRSFLVLVLLGGPIVTSVPAIAEESSQGVCVAVLYPIATNRNPDVSTDVELSLLYGRVGTLHGFGLNGIAAMQSREFHGFQFTGIYSQVNGTVGGFRFTGIANYSTAGTRGIQAAGMVNVNQGAMRGIEFGGLFNLVGKDLRGFQGTTVANIVDEDGHAFQLAGFANALGGSLHGAQVSGGFNYVGHEMSGLQVGIANTAVVMDGVQIGVGNFADHAKGLQLGAYNHTDVQEGVPIGMINAAGNGDTDWIVYGSNLSGFNTGIGTSVRRFYSMLTAGTPDPQGDVSKTLILTWNYGYAIPAGRRTSIGLDLGFAHYIPEKVDDPAQNDRLHYALQARGLIERTLGRKTKAFVGAGVARIADNYDRLNAPSETKPLFFGGVALY